MNAVASASKLVKACTSTSGETATRTMSHGRRFTVRPVAHTVTSHAAARKNAVMSK